MEWEELFRGSARVAIRAANRETRVMIRMGVVCIGILLILPHEVGVTGLEVSPDR